MISTAFEAEMMVGSWFVPDESDFLLPVAGHAVGFLYKSAKKAKVLAKVLEKATGVGERALSVIKKERRLEQKSDNIIIRITNDVEKEGRLGHVSPGSQLGEDAAEDALKAERTRFIGEFCFVAGTKVLMADGSLKAIEQVKVGDLVMSKDEANSEVAPKPVTKIFERVAPATLTLTFSNGEAIETTQEHPFFVQDKGFTPAGLVALGNSIVTRAGPSLKVTGIERRNVAQTVYNFSAADFHTYFVGKSQAWVHNEDCERIQGLMRLYPSVLDPRTGRAIPLPSSIREIVPLGERVNWNNMERANFIAEWYNRGYPMPTGGWEHYDIHHIHPRELGGNNDFWNLVPVERETHKLFNAFWARFTGL